jgi:hypothetical protein
MFCLTSHETKKFYKVFDIPVDKQVEGVLVVLQKKELEEIKNKSLDSNYSALSTSLIASLVNQQNDSESTSDNNEFFNY